MDIIENIELSKLFEACEKGDVTYLSSNEEKVKELLSLELGGENSPLIAAADSGCSETVKKLIVLGADVNYKTDLGETALDVACVAQDLESVKILLEYGADPLSVDRFGVSVLERAENSSNKIALLIKRAITGLDYPHCGH